MQTANHSPRPPTPPTPVLTGLGQALRWLRERQARKQYQVASAAGITKGMLSAYETGRQRPSLETLDKLLETLGCDLNDVHNALQIVNGRPEQMKAWRGGLGSPAPGELSTSAAAMPPKTAPMAPTSAWPGEIAPGIPSYGAYAGMTGPLVSEVHEPPRGRILADLHQVLGQAGMQRSSEPSPAAPGSDLAPLPPLPALPPLPPLPPEEELAMAQMLEGFHNLLRYWHRCLTALGAPGPAGPTGPSSPPGRPAAPGQAGPSRPASPPNLPGTPEPPDSPHGRKPAASPAPDPSDTGRPERPSPTATARSTRSGSR